MLSEEEKAELREKVRKDFEREKEEQRIRAELEEQERAKERNRVAQEEQERVKAKLLAGLEEQEKAKVEDARHLKIVLSVGALIMLVLIGSIKGLEGTAERQEENSRIDNAEYSPVEQAYMKCRIAGLTEQMCHEYSLGVYSARSDVQSLMMLRELCADPEYHVHYAGLRGCVNAVNSFIYYLQRGDLDNL